MIALETIAYSLGVIAITSATVLFMMGGLSYSRRYAASGSPGAEGERRRPSIGRRQKAQKAQKEQRERGEQKEREE